MRDPAVFKIWISVFGPPSSHFSDNGGEFNNEAMNIVVKTTAAEALWSNGLCERHNEVLSEMMIKTQADAKCSTELALFWAVHAKKSLANVHGLSPYQIALRYVPKLPIVLINKPPAMEEIPTSHIVRDNLKAISAARKAFIETENSERIKRALRHNIRPSCHYKFFAGDQVFYKRNDSKHWKGPGKVLGHDGQQVLIKHGGIYVRVHPCHVMLDRNKQCSQTVIDRQCQDKKIDQSTDNKVNELNYDMDHYDEEVSLEHVEIEKDTTDSTVQQEPEKLQNDEATDTHPMPLQQQQEKKGRPKSVLKKDIHEEYIPVDGNRWIAAKLINRAGKATGWYSSCWSIQTIHKGEPKVLDFDKDVQKWRELTSTLPDDDCNSEEQGVENVAEVEFTAETVNVCQVFNLLKLTVKSLEQSSWNYNIG